MALKSKKYAYTQRAVKEYAISYSMLFPFLIVFCVFTLIPIICAVVLSFTNFNMLEVPTFTNWMNYRRLFFEDDVFLTALKNTLIFAVLTGPLSYIFAFFFAWLINEMPTKLRVFMTILFYAPSVSGNAYFIWQYMFSNDSYGLVNGLLISWGILNEPILWFTDPQYNLTIIIIVQLWLSLGVSFLAFIAGLQSVDASQYEAAAVDGVKNRFQELWYITLPNMKDMLLFGAVMQISGAFSVGDITQALSGGFNSVQYSTLTIINHMTDYGTVRYEMGYASAISVILFIMVYASKKLIFKILK